jgi:hypothetical protein
MTIADKLPEMDDKDLVVLRANAVRLQEGSAPKQQAAAADLLPLIDAEMADRKAKLPPPPPKAPRKPSAKTVAAKKAKAAAAPPA